MPPTASWRTSQSFWKSVLLPNVDQLGPSKGDHHVMLMWADKLSFPIMAGLSLFCSFFHLRHIFFYDGEKWGKLTAPHLTCFFPICCSVHDLGSILFFLKVPFNRDPNVTQLWGLLPLPAYSFLIPLYSLENASLGQDEYLRTSLDCPHPYVAFISDYGWIPKAVSSTPILANLLTNPCHEL